MTLIGLIREEKIPADNRVALTPAQCKWIHRNSTTVRIVAQSSDNRCFSNKEYQSAGVEVRDRLDECDILLGIKEVPPEKLIPGKSYLFFSHTRKNQPHNRKLFQTVIEKKITLIDYECLEHEDGARIIGFGFFAGIVGAHNGLMAYGNRSGVFNLSRVFKQKSFRELIHTYFGLKVPNLRIVVTGSGRVAHGALEIMNLVGIHEVEPDEYLERSFTYPVYVQLKGADLYAHRTTGKYSRSHFHESPAEYISIFPQYAFCTDILMNGVYWDKQIPRLFEKELVQDSRFAIQTIADITDDVNGSVPINLGDQTIDDPVYGVSKTTFEKVPPYQKDAVDIMAVGNLPNELPRDASRYFGEQLIKFILQDLVTGGNAAITNATLVKEGIITEPYQYLSDYAKELE